MNLQIADNTTSSEVMDHHGLVAASCQDLNLVEKINARIGSDDPRRVIQPGIAIMAMIINGLGFSNRRLYLTPQFFESKCMEQLFNEDIKAKHLDDHTLGKALDEISAYGASKLFGEVAFEIAQEQGLLGKLSHLDSTSFVLHGEYDTPEVETIEVKHGYSKDHRPDLKQVMLSMAVSGDAQIPFWMEPQDGNSSDKCSFHQTIARVREFQSSLKTQTSDDFIWVADSALYSKERLLFSNHYLWVSRVPESIKDAASLLERDTDEYTWVELDKGYRYSVQRSQYGGIEQRWLLIYSEQACQREKKTFDKLLAKQLQACEKEAWHLSNQMFSCKADALAAHKKLNKKYSYHLIEPTIEPVSRHKGSGRPKKGKILMW
ncbi:IS1634 family transposase [Cysteiniphilum halobium]|uniref:IS1634 family transposase n=1 Tax=Cysteiniphilum halobium TaxID=2219059 RepID=UPI000E65301F|nr:IS1634 family transposase [Cysteiniphilum halobium]